MAQRLHLVRHAAVEARADLPPADWPLTADASVDDLLGAEVLPDGARWFCSPEPKARQSAALLTGSDVAVLEGLAEVNRDPEVLPADEFTALVSAYLADGQAPANWESRVDATLRIVNAAQTAMVLADTADCVLVGHRTAFTLLVAALAGMPPDVAAWQSMQMPDHCALHARADGGFEVTSDWGTWAA